MNVLVIGAGVLGQVVGDYIKERGSGVSFYDSDPQKLTSESLSYTVPKADMVFFCVPSWTLREAVESVAPHLKENCPVVSFSKGIEESSLKTVPEILTELVPQFPIAVIGGPMLAGEIKLKQPAVAVIGSSDQALLIKLAVLFSSPVMRVETFDDPHSVSLVGVLKNIYAVSLGIADGLEVSGNQKGWLVSQAVEEMVQTGKILGVKEEIVLGSAGVGDLVATGFSKYSRNREIGHQIVQTGVCNLRGEGLSSLPGLIKRLGTDAQKFPLIQLIHTIGILCEPARENFTAFFNGEKR